MPSWSKKRILFTLTILLLCAVGIFQAFHSELSRRWLANRYAGRAEALTKGGAHQAARLAAVKALSIDPDCLRALKALLDNSDSTPNDLLLIRDKIAGLTPGDQENQCNLALVAIACQRFDIAGQVIDKLEHDHFPATGLLELRARLAAAQGNLPEADSQAQLLLQKDPKHPAGRLIHALALVSKANPADLPAADKALEELLAVDSLKLEAQRGLRQSALLQKQIARAKQFSEAITSNPSATRFDDWLNHSEILFQENPERLPEILKELTTRAESNPQALGAIAMWLRKNGQADRVVPWAEGCKALQNNPVLTQMIQADTLLFQKGWPRLSSYLLPLNWGNQEYYRLALLARALREQNEAFSTTWNSATAAAIPNHSSATQLAALIASWQGWEEQQSEFLWLVAGKDPSNFRWALSSLNELYQAQKNTSGLLRVSEELHRLFPSNEGIQNNLAFYSALLNTRLDRAVPLIETLYQAHPQEPEIASTFSLAMLRKGEFKKALEALEKLPPAQRSSKAIAPYFAAALAANGRMAEALKIKESVDSASLLPQEIELLQFQ